MLITFYIFIHLYYFSLLFRFFKFKIYPRKKELN